MYKTVLSVCCLPLLWAQMKLKDYRDRPSLIQDTEHLLFVQYKLMGKNMKSHFMFSMIHLNSMSLLELEKSFKIGRYRVERPKEGPCNIEMELKYCRPQWFDESFRKYFSLIKVNGDI